MSTSQKIFTSYDPQAFRTRYMVQVVALADNSACEQIDPETLNVCQAETKRACCICGTPTCLGHERRPAYQPCVIHMGQPRPGNDLCCVCVVCAELSQELQELVYQFRRKLNREGE